MSVRTIWHRCIWNANMNIQTVIGSLLAVVLETNHQSHWRFLWRVVEEWVPHVSLLRPVLLISLYSNNNNTNSDYKTEMFTKELLDQSSQFTHFLLREYLAFVDPNPINLVCCAQFLMLEITVIYPAIEFSQGAWQPSATEYLGITRVMHSSS